MPLPESSPPSDSPPPLAPAGKKKRPPLASGPSFFVPAITAFSRDPLGFLRTATERYGDVFTIHALAMRFTFLMSSELRREFFQADDSLLDLQPIIERVLKSITGQKHFYSREFSDFSMNHMRSAMWRTSSAETFAEAVQSEVDTAVTQWIEKQELDLFAASSRFVVNTTVRCFMGEQIRVHHGDTVALAYETLESHARSFIGALLPNALSPSARRAAKAQKDIFDILSLMLDEHKRTNADSPGSLRYLQGYIDHRRGDGSAFTTSEMMSHLLALIFSIHTNTAGLLGWTLSELLARPQLLGDLTREQDEFATQHHGIASYQDLRQMPLLDHCIREASRLHGTPILVRKAVKPFRAGIYEIPEGDMVCISPILAHTNPAVFEDPQSFNPNRFRDEPAVKQYIINGDFIPFGMGTHRCIGEHMANLMIKTMCNTLLRRAQLSLAEETLPPPNWRDGGTAWPVRPVRVHIKPR